MKPKKQTKPNEDKSNNQSKATTIFNDLINKRKELMNKLYDSADYNKLKFEYMGPTKDVSSYEYMDSKKLFNAIRNSQIGFSEAKNDARYKSKQNETEGKGLKVLTSKQMLQRLPIALAQVKAGNNSENLLNEIRQIVYSLYQSKEITKKVYSNIIKSIQI